MVHPGLFVHAFSHLQEHVQVPRAQLELALRPAEDERFATEISGRVLAPVPHLRLSLDETERLRLPVRPGQHLAVLDLDRWHPPERLQRSLRRLSHRQRGVDRFQHRRRDLLRIRGDHQHSELARQCQLPRLPGGREEMVRLIDDDPVRTPPARSQFL